MKVSIYRIVLNSKVQMNVEVDVKYNQEDEKREKKFTD